MVLPFGLCSAPEIFQQLLQNVLDGIGHMEVSMDDILLHAENKINLREIYDKVAKRLMDAGITLNKDKKRKNNVLGPHNWCQWFGN